MGFNTYPGNPFPQDSERSGGAGESYTLPIAGAETLGGVKVGSGLAIDAETGVLSNTNGTPYVLPAAGADTLGGVKVGSGLAIDAETGVLSASATGIEYSFTERKIGKWLDGSDLYEKVYHLIEDGQWKYTFSSNNIDIALNNCAHGFVYGFIGERVGDGTNEYIDSFNNGNEIIMVFNKGTGMLYFTTTQSYYNLYAVMRYTKTPTP